jgi:hypothetical protein
VHVQISSHLGLTPQRRVHAVLPLKLAATDESLTVPLELERQLPLRPVKFNLARPARSPLRRADRGETVRRARPQLSCGLLRFRGSSDDFDNFVDAVRHGVLPRQSSTNRNGAALRRMALLRVVLKFDDAAPGSMILSDHAASQ